MVGELILRLLLLCCSVLFSDSFLAASRESRVTRVHSSYNPNDQETPDERRARMDMVRQIQASFYQDTTGNETASAWLKVPKDDPTIIEELPLWRVQWTEFPGYQNVLNVHVPHYTHMFRQLIFQHSPPWYFGHVFMHEGSKNLGNPDYFLPERLGNGTVSEVDEEYAPLIGTLMQITDYAVQDDGRLTLIVQGVGRFQIIEATQQVPYAVAKVERLPDDECWQQFVEPLVGGSSSTNSSPELDSSVTRAAKVAAVSQEENLRTLDYLQTKLDRKDTLFEVSPLSNINGTMILDFNNLRRKMESAFADQLEAEAQTLGSDELLFAASTLPLPDMSFLDNEVVGLERDVWIEIDRMLRLLGEVQPGLKIPVPAQLLGLLPTGTKWPPGFKLESYADKLEAGDSMVGTYSKSPFVRLSRTYPNYPVLKRAGRFSYVVWMILYTVSFDNQGATKEEVLRTTSLRERLSKAHGQLQRLNDALTSMNK